MIKEVEVRSLRGLTFRKGAFEAARINIITGCNGAYKTTLLEAVAAALLTRADRGEMYALAALASTMRMDDFWLYGLLRDGFEISIDGTRYRGTPLAYPGGYGGRIEDGEGPALEVAISVMQIPTPWGAAIQYNTSINPNPQRPPPERPARFVAFATPNPIAQNFVYNLMKISNLAKAVELLQRLYGEEGFKTITIKHDELNRSQLYISVKDRDLPIQYLGSGYAAVLLLTLAATRDIVLYDRKPPPPLARRQGGHPNDRGRNHPVDRHNPKPRSHKHNTNTRQQRGKHSGDKQERPREDVPRRRGTTQDRKARTRPQRQLPVTQ
ncbi:hypothetical protein [Pyrobaculum neutrophilum]|uniref:hypothetical protein n=1 Tax=Pyrobaculum neutrophilum TaxID=70771 RepID=UPI0001618673|nr:hypothetical protein [Pyrobaculum neutrophilum]